MAISELSIGGPEGARVTGLHRNVISGSAATVTLTQAQSGSLVLFDSAAGQVFTLPTPVAGMQFEFMQTVSVTSNASKIVTGSITTQFLVGSVIMDSIATASPAGFSANGTTIAALSSNGSTTGGLIGSRYIVTGISATQWAIHGVVVGSGTLATPFATS